VRVFLLLSLLFHQLPFFHFSFFSFKTGPCFTHGRKRILSAGRGEPLSLSIFLNFKEEEEEEEEEEERKKE